MTLRACARCDAPASRTLGSEVLCPLCREAILGPIRERVATRELEEAMRSVRDGLLTPPEEATDENMTEWGQRLSRAAQEGYITHAEARSAWRRAVIRLAA